jgi:hypothetical protein
MSDGIFSRIIVPRYPIVFQESEKAFSIPDKAFLIGQNIFGNIGLMQNYMIRTYA